MKVEFRYKEMGRVGLGKPAYYSTEYWMLKIVKHNSMPNYTKVTDWPDDSDRRNTLKFTKLAVVVNRKLIHPKQQN